MSTINKWTTCITA